ncbi:MAG: AAA family ATPase [Methanobacteriota archaeon]|nr:MAG: AAA family ATPase [Euryarchaeota archaeon]
MERKGNLKTAEIVIKFVDTVEIDGVELILSHPTEIRSNWIGQDMLMKQLLAAWLTLDKEDIPLTPRIIGPPGVGKTTLAYAAAKTMGQEVYFYQATVDTRPEDLIIFPVIGDQQQIRYVASPLVTAMIRGGIVILDEGNRMPEKSWASLAPLMDHRRYVESQIAGITVKAHPKFRMVTTMNTDASTFELPEYISSRLQPVIELDFPNEKELLRIIKYNLPYAPEDVIGHVISIMNEGRAAGKFYSIRAGIQVVQYALRLQKVLDLPIHTCVAHAVEQVFGDPDY